MSTVQSKDAFLKNIGSLESIPLTFEELECAARTKIQAGAFGYIRSGAGGEETLRRNEAAFGKWSIVPRVLNDVSNVDTRITLFGRTYETPILAAPVGMQGIAHEEGELASARAAASLGVPFIASTVSTYSLEEIADAIGDKPKWFQLYWSNDENVSYSMVKRAEEAGYDALVITVDTVMIGWRVEDIRNAYSPLKQGFGKANYINDPEFIKSLPDQDPDTVIQGILENIHHPSLGWKQIAELKMNTSLPVIIKGILHPADAVLAFENGVDAIIVSNHGGRQLDGVTASLDALPAVVAAVDGKVPVLLDSGIRRGADVIKALALGATAVLVGRPFVYGLAVAGQEGVEQVLDHLISETKVSLGLSGVTNITEAKRIKLIRN